MGMSWRKGAEIMERERKEGKGGKEERMNIEKGEKDERRRGE